MTTSFEKIGIEKIKVMEKHTSVMKPLMDLYNEKYALIIPAVERKDHPLHNTYVYTTNKITTISVTLLKMLEEGEL